MKDVSIIQAKQSVKVLNGLPESVFMETLQNVLATPYTRGVYDLDKTKKVSDTCFTHKHLSVFEHLNITLDCITTIGTYKGYTRHRHCAFTIESTSFTKYKGEHLVITTDPLSLEDMDALKAIYSRYEDIPDQRKARDFLPQCSAARMLMTTNVREWRHIISERRDPKENWLTIELCNLMWKALSADYPYFFPPQDAEDSPRTIYDYWDGAKARYGVRPHHCKSDTCPHGKGAHLCDKEWHECSEFKA